MTLLPAAHAMAASNAGKRQAQLTHCMAHCTTCCATAAHQGMLGWFQATYASWEPSALSLGDAKKS